MLPHGFEWRPYVGGPALYYGGRVVALVSALDNGRFRVTVGVGLRGLRHEFMQTEAGSMRYVEAWASKWQAEIREGVGGMGRPGW